MNKFVPLFYAEDVFEQPHLFYEAVLCLAEYLFQAGIRLKYHELNVRIFTSDSEVLIGSAQRHGMKLDREIINNQV